MARKPGRPKGSGLQDGPHLDQVADLLVTKQAKTPNAAIMEVHRRERLSEHVRESFRRRMSRKWSKQGPERLEAAKGRLAERRPVRITPADLRAGLRMEIALPKISDATCVSQVQRCAESLRSVIEPLSEAMRRYEESMKPLTTRLAEQSSRYTEAKCQLDSVSSRLQTVAQHCAFSLPLAQSEKIFPSIQLHNEILRTLNPRSGEWD